MNNQQSSFRLPDQNNVMMIGRLTRNPELRCTSTGKAVCSFDIAISRRVKDTVTGEWKDVDPTFVPVVVWGDQAERCGEKLQKGVPVHVEGRLQTNRWNGSDGVKRSRLEVVASRVQFLFVIKQKLTEMEVPISQIDDSNIIKSDDMGSSTEDEIPF